MAMLKNAEQYDWSTWLVGIMRSFVSGSAGAVVGVLGPMATDAHDFNLTSDAGLHHTLVSMGVGFLIGGIVHMAMFLQTHSAPDLVVVKETESVVTDLGAGQTQVSTVETTKTVSPEAK